jgi:hypothetical protein
VEKEKGRKGWMGGKRSASSEVGDRRASGD